MEDRKTEYRLWVHAGGVFALVLAAALLLTAYMEYGAIQQDRRPMRRCSPKWERPGCWRPI